MAWNGRKSERQKAIEAEDADGGLVGKDVVRVDLSVLATSPRGYSGPRGEQMGRLVRAGFEKAKRERFKAGRKARLERLVTLKRPGAKTAWADRARRPWRLRDSVLLAIGPDEQLPSAVVQARADPRITRSQLAGLIKPLIDAGFIRRVRVASIPAADRALGVKGHEVEWVLTAEGLLEQNRLREERELDEMMR
jgi:hypothetical protein